MEVAGRDDYGLVIRGAKSEKLRARKRDDREARRLSGLVGLLCALLPALFLPTGVLERPELATHDLRFRLRGPRTTRARVVIAEIADSTLAAWPEPRLLWGPHY